MKPSGGGAALRSLRAPNTFSFYTLTPCRVYDSRGGPNPLPAGTETVAPMVGSCGIPTAADMVSLNVTAVSPTAGGHLRLYAAGSFLPETATVNYGANQTRGNNAIVSLGAGGAVAVYVNQVSGTTHVVLDVNGYFSSGDACSIWQAPPSPTSLGLDTVNRTFFWGPVPGATSYNVYIRAVPGECGFFAMVTRSDQVFVGVTSPFDISPFNQCNVCYHVDVTSLSGQCESLLRSDLGQPAPVSFSLLPCVP